FSSRRSPHYHPLHSFPTRRSSDLAHYRRQASRSRELAGTATTPAVKNRLDEVAREYDRLADLVDVASSNILADEGRTVVQRHLRDRKSTRLNSSHVAISYAVFCLK